jgi:hypothetical protein
MPFFGNNKTKPHQINPMQSKLNQIHNILYTIPDLQQTGYTGTLATSVR